MKRSFESYTIDARLERLDAIEAFPVGGCLEFEIGVLLYDSHLNPREREARGVRKSARDRGCVKAIRNSASEIKKV